jgi:hypothetical protein
MVKGDSRHAWNKGLTGIYSEETKRRIGLAKRKKKDPAHKKKIAESMKRLKKLRQCSACSVRSRWIYIVRMPFTECPLMLCDTDLIEQFHALSPEDKKRVEILQP